MNTWLVRVGEEWGRLLRSHGLTGDWKLFEETLLVSVVLGPTTTEVIFGEAHEREWSSAEECARRTLAKVIRERVMRLETLQRAISGADEGERSLGDRVAILAVRVAALELKESLSRPAVGRVEPEGVADLRADLNELGEKVAYDDKRLREEAMEYAARLFQQEAERRQALEARVAALEGLKPKRLGKKR